MKTLRLLGESPFPGDCIAGPRPGIATLFPDDAVLVTLPGIHATQRQDYLDELNRTRRAGGLPPLSEAEQDAIRESAVDLMLPAGQIQIRPEPFAMDLAFEADELLQTRVPKHLIRFLRVDNPGVRQAIKERGETWRICPLPRSAREIVEYIERSRVTIEGPTTYYYSAEQGTRFLTCGEFARLAQFDDATLAIQLAEIGRFSATRSTTGNPDVSFFQAGVALGPGDFAGMDFAALPPAELRAWHAEASRRFTAAVPRDLRTDNPHGPAWRNEMFRHLCPPRQETVSTDLFRDVGPEFYLQIQWLPGARIEDGELIFDSVFDEADRNPGDADLRRLCDLRVQRFIGNFIREFGALDYVNVGFIAASIRHHATTGEAHRAYIAEIKAPGDATPVIRILRIAKWGVRERLEQNGRDMLTAMVETERYLDYILDRRLGCWQLGMRVPRRFDPRRIPEVYDGTRREYHGHPVWVHYFERDYIKGVATGKIPDARYADPSFTLPFARLLGEAAAVNLVVGRMTADARHVIFDDGDEILVEDAQGNPSDIIVADHAGTFVDCRSDLRLFAAAYAEPVIRRRKALPDVRAFAHAYLRGLEDRLNRIRGEYRKRRPAFDTLFKHQSQEPGSIAWRWRHVLDRLDRTDPAALAAEVARHIPDLADATRPPTAHAPAA